MEEILKNLTKRGFEPYFVQTKEEANALILEIIGKGATVGFGGSVTVKELGLVPLLQENGCITFHREAYPDVNPQEMYKLQHEAAWYVTSTNAVTENGDFVNIDGRGNRVADMVHGPKNVLIVTGTNKIVQTIDEGILRTRNVSAPKNTVRLHKKTPCAVTGKCEYCNSPDTICRATVILHHPMFAQRVAVVIINESLGY